MIPGFVGLGAVTVLFQLLVVAAFYGYLRIRHPVDDPAARRRVVGVLAGGAALAALGQLAALGAIGSLQVLPLLSFRQALLVKDVGLAVALVGYLGVAAAVVMHGLASD